MRAMGKPELTETEFLEGGIFSTYAAVMAHRRTAIAWNSSIPPSRNQPCRT